MRFSEIIARVYRDVFTHSGSVIALAGGSPIGGPRLHSGPLSGRGADGPAAFSCHPSRSEAMTEVTLKGTPVQVAGEFPQAGQQAKPFRLVGADLADVELAAFAGKRKILNIF